MENKQKKAKSLKGHLLGGAAAFTLAVGALFGSPQELLAIEDVDDDLDAQPAAVSVGKRLPDHSGERSLPLKSSLMARIRAWFLSMPAVVRGVALLPAWCVGRVLLALLGAVAPLLSPVWQALLNALILTALFLLVYKLLFPNRSIRSFFKKRNLLLFICGGIVLSAGDALLRRYVSNGPALSICVRLALGFVVLTLIAYRVLGKRTKTPAITNARIANP